MRKKHSFIVLAILILVLGGFFYFYKIKGYSVAINISLKKNQAALVPIEEELVINQEELSNISDAVKDEPAQILSSELAVEPNLASEVESKPEPEKNPLSPSQTEKKMTFEEIQEALDDISEQLDIISQEVYGLTGVNKPTEIIKDEEEEKPEEDLEKEKNEKPNSENLENKKEIILCERSGEPAKSPAVFNEIAWMGSDVSENNEWIELKNISTQKIDLSGWQISDKEKQIKIIFNQKTVPANSILLLERTDDNSVPQITADLIYSGGLNNTNEALYLFNGNCQLIDEAIANPNWLAGDNTSKRTMERKSNLEWQTSYSVNGTPKGENSIGYSVSSGGGGTTSPNSESQNTTTSLLIPKILITEIQINSTSSEEDEFIELYNPNNEEVNLSSFSIQKTYSTSTTIYKKNFESNNKIPAKSYFLIVYGSSTDQNLLNLADLTHKSFNLAFNNTIYLVSDQEKIENTSDTNIIDFVGFGKNVFYKGSGPAINLVAGKSLARKWSSTTENYIDTNDNQNDFELKNPTPKSKNLALEPTTTTEPIIPVEPATTTEPATSTEEFNSTVVNEIAWMGTQANSSDEWIEFYNNTDNAIDLNNWNLSWSHETTSHSFIFSTSIGNTIISAKGFYLLERTDSKTTDIEEDQIFTGSLSNSGEKLELRNASNNLIDLVDCSNGWFFWPRQSRLHFYGKN